MCGVSNFDIKKLCVRERERRGEREEGRGERDDRIFFLINCKIVSKIFLGLFNMVLIYYYRE